MGDPNPIGQEKELGRTLRRQRDLRDASLTNIASAAEISTAYLQKLEAGAVKQPSPNVLHQLARALELDYAELMRMAGYIVPNTEARNFRRRNELTYAASSEPLTDEEANELSEYLAWYRSRKR